MWRLWCVYTSLLWMLSLFCRIYSFLLLGRNKRRVVAAASVTLSTIRFSLPRSYPFKFILMFRGGVCVFESRLRMETIHSWYCSQTRTQRNVCVALCHCFDLHSSLQSELSLFCCHDKRCLFMDAVKKTRLLEDVVGAGKGLGGGEGESALL